MTDEPKFQVDAVYSPTDVDYLTLECRDCSYVGELEVPVDLEELNRRATEHEQVCETPGDAGAGALERGPLQGHQGGPLTPER